MVNEPVTPQTHLKCVVCVVVGAVAIGVHTFNNNSPPDKFTMNIEDEIINLVCGNYEE